MNHKQSHIQRSIGSLSTDYEILSEFHFYLNQYWKDFNFKNKESLKNKYDILKENVLPIGLHLYLSYLLFIIEKRKNLHTLIQKNIEIKFQENDIVDFHAKDYFKISYDNILDEGDVLGFLSMKNAISVTLKLEGNYTVLVYESNDE